MRCWNLLRYLSKMNSLITSRKHLLQVLIKRRFSLSNINYSYEKFPSMNILSYNLNPSEEERAKEISDLHDVFNSLSKPSLEKLLIDKLDFDEATAKELSIKSNSAFMSWKFSTNIDLIKDYMDLAAIRKKPKELLTILAKTPLLLAHNLSSLKEIGVPVDYKTLKRTPPWKWKATVEKLREDGLIPHDRNIPREIFDTLQAPQRVLDELPTSYECMPLKELSTELSKIFFRWMFEDGEQYFHDNWSMLQHRSFTIMFHNKRLFKHHFKFSDKKIKLYVRLLIAFHPLKEYSSYRDKICGYDFKRLVHNYPHLTQLPFQVLLRNVKLLEYIHGYGTSSEVAKVLYHNNDVLLSRIEFYLKNTSLAEIRLTPYNIFFLLNFNSYTKVLEDYQKNLRSSTKVLPELSKLRFQVKKISLASHRKMMSWYINYFYILILGLGEQRAKEITDESRLMALPDLATVKENYVFLLNQGYSKEFIGQSPHVILYPCLIVKMCEKELVNTKYGELYYQTRNFDKLLQLLHCKVHRMCLTYGKIG